MTNKEEREYALDKCIAVAIFGYGQVVEEELNGTPTILVGDGIRERWDPMDNHMHAAAVDFWLLRRGVMTIGVRDVDGVLVKYVQYFANVVDSDIREEHEMVYNGTMRDMRRVKYTIAKEVYSNHILNCFKPKQTAVGSL